ncbi:MAG: helix-turn-helix domain-containing protein [Spirochaetota bacterium]
MRIAEIGKIVWFHRKKSGMTQKQLADLAGVGKTVVFDVEKGKETVRLDTLQRLLTTLNIKMHLTSPLLHLMEEEHANSKSV